MSISSVTSEVLQAKIRSLLPSQLGFGTDLSASDTIIPIVDLTATAEGSSTPELLQTALAFGSQTAYFTENTTTDLANTPGFYRVVGGSTVRANSGSQSGNYFKLTDGATTKIVWRHQMLTSAASLITALNFDFVAYLNAGETLQVESNNVNAIIAGSVRQIATSNGVAVLPPGS